MCGHKSDQTLGLILTKFRAHVLGRTILFYKTLPNKSLRFLQNVSNCLEKRYRVQQEGFYKSRTLKTRFPQSYSNCFICAGNLRMLPNIRALIKLILKTLLPKSISYLKSVLSINPAPLFHKLRCLDPFHTIWIHEPRYFCKIL